ncbi:amidohydrolase family protein [Pseudomassariella vexata]|uniref:Amidohydrolase family protein n=1 Tax=Pseudomassariella vexata TaxID=1141098 RepID=A0A1Y2DUT4_9PEZI|nr:amidohydrolase family protein [Pseudomassariella vexata]ORY63042.1 amidohydrolase family protein [Pseudomassariella vexata]
MAADFPIIDSHIHLYPKSELDTLAWCNADSPLAKQHSLDEYKAASAGSNIKGFIFVETDRKNDLEAGVKDGSGWKHPLEEVSWLKRIALGQPRDGEGHAAEDAGLCAAYIPWAPLPSGPEAMEKYIDLVKEEAGESFRKVRGFRYLVQDKPDKTMLSDNFIESLKLLGRRGFVFDLGINLHERGRIQLEEAVEMIERAHEGVPEEEKVTFIINHMCKPDLTVYNIHIDKSFIAWRTAIFTLSKASKTYMKLSGGFPEMTDGLKARTPEDIFGAISPWLSILVAAFGPSRIMFASDWPVCTVGVDDAWNKWKKIVERLCYMASFEDEEQGMIWSGTAMKAYGIEEA